MNTATRSVDEYVGERVHQLMWRNRVRQADVYEAMGDSRSNFSKKLRGTVTWSATDMAIAARALGVTVDDLMPAGADVAALCGLPSDPLVVGERARRYSKPQPSDPKSDTPVDKRYSGNIPAARQPNTTGIQITESGTAAVPVSGRVAYLESTPNSSDQTIIIPRQFGAGRRIC